MSDIQYDAVQSYSRALGISITTEEAAVLQAREPPILDGAVPRPSPDEERREVRVLEEMAGRVAFAHGLSPAEASDLVSLSLIGIDVNEYFRDWRLPNADPTGLAADPS